MFTLDGEEELIMAVILTIFGRWELTVADDIYIRS
jgi:hypothetical protein